MYKVVKHTDDKNEWANLHSLRNKCTRLIAKAKQEYILLKMQEHSGDAKKFWHLIDSVFVGTSYTQMDINLTDPETGLPVLDIQAPDYMNKSLTTAGKKLADQLPNVLFKDTLQNFTAMLKFRRITVEETLKQIEGISMYKSSAIDDLSSRVLKDALMCLPIPCVISLMYPLTREFSLRPGRERM